MDKYYYLISQLPLLQFGEKTFLTRDSFLEEARKWLSEKEVKEIEKADLDNLEARPETSFLREYKQFELTLRREMASYREKLSEQDLAQISKEKRVEHQENLLLTKEILDGNPLEVERKLFLYRWQQIDELAVGFNFSYQAVLAYFLKLQILEKMLEFNKEDGIKEFDSLAEVKEEVKFL